MSILLPKSEASSQRNEISTPPIFESEPLLPENDCLDDHPQAKPNANEPYLDIPLQSAFARSSNTFSDVSSYSAGNDNERRPGRLLTVSNGSRWPSRSPPRPPTWKGKMAVSWAKNKGLAMVVIAQLFAVMMNVTTRLLETDGVHGSGMEPLQILFARMAVTLFLTCGYQWLAKVEHAPFGPRAVWKLLVARGVGGFFGDSLQYLPLSDVTVITFLAPTVACWACSILLHEPFTRAEQLAGLVSFLGVVLIARPTSFLPSSSSPPPPASGTSSFLPTTNNNNNNTTTTTTSTPPLQPPQTVTPSQRLGAVGVSLFGVLGAACAYTTIRWIGQRAHPLFSVNYFAAWCTLVSTVALLLLPDTGGFRLPASSRQWIYLLFLGVCGFLMQFLLTTGLAYEKSSRATNMVYTQMLFALAFDKVVFDTMPGVLSLVGSCLILGSALFVAVRKGEGDVVVVIEGGGEEAGLLLGGGGDEGEASEGVGRGLLGEVREVQLRKMGVVR